MGIYYADDIEGGSNLLMLRDWWSKIVENGPENLVKNIVAQDKTFTQNKF